MLGGLNKPSFSNGAAICKILTVMGIWIMLVWTTSMIQPLFFENTLNLIRSEKPNFLIVKLKGTLA